MDGFWIFLEFANGWPVGPRERRVKNGSKRRGIEVSRVAEAKGGACFRGKSGVGGGLGWRCPVDIRAGSWKEPEPALRLSLQQKLKSAGSWGK